MKRSEMVEEIRKILAMNGKDNGYGELEEALLHTIELKGILPPKAAFNDDNGLGDYEDYAWESEDEA